MPMPDHLSTLSRTAPDKPPSAAHIHAATRSQPSIAGQLPDLGAALRTWAVDGYG